MKQYLDSEAFAKALKTKRVIELGIGVRDVSKQMKVSAATISRMENNYPSDIGNFIKACNWLKVSVCEFIKSKK